MSNNTFHTYISETSFAVLASAHADRTPPQSLPEEGNL